MLPNAKDKDWLIESIDENVAKAFACVKNIIPAQKAIVQETLNLLANRIKTSADDTCPNITSKWFRKG